jgi:hypothetical protein
MDDADASYCSLSIRIETNQQRDGRSIMKWVLTHPRGLGQVGVVLPTTLVCERLCTYPFT